MKVYVGTAVHKDYVEIFLLKPDMWGNHIHAWRNRGLLVRRDSEYAKKFNILPVHQTQEIMEYTFEGNGRLSDIW